MAEIFHLALVEDWDAARRAGAVTDSTRGVTLAEEGFIHCSFPEQLARTAARFFGDLDEVAVLRIDTERLTSRLVTEDLYGAGEAFPHVYGPINLDAVTDVRVVSPRAL